MIVSVPAMISSMPVIVVVPVTAVVMRVSRQIMGMVVMAFWKLIMLPVIVVIAFRFVERFVCHGFPLFFIIENPVVTLESSADIILIEIIGARSKPGRPAVEKRSHA